MPSVLALPAIPPEYEGVSVLCGLSLISVAPRCEIAGLAFFEKVEKRGRTAVGAEDAAAKGVADPSLPSSSSAESLAAGGAAKDSSGKKKNYKDNSTTTQRVRQAIEKGVNLYKLVCVPRTATSEEIRKQWRKLALVFHPDKAAAANPDTSLVPGVETMTADELHAQFLERHNAFEILMNPTMRRQYDSYAVFDDRLPSAHELAVALSAGADKFYDLCRQNFEKEAHWCVRQPVPDFGDGDTPLDKVKEFYKYWLTYESWRDFTNAGEFDLEEAQDREDRKWMQKQNWKIVKSLLKEERQRVLKFVTAAEERDPRLRVNKQPTSAGGARPKTAASKAQALADLKASILAKRKRLLESKLAVRSAVKEWITEPLTKDEVLGARLDKFLGNDSNVDKMSDLEHILSNITKRYKEPTTEAATELKQVLSVFLTEQKL